MEFRTAYTPRKRDDINLSPRNPVILIGSCFSSEIGSKFQECAWDALINPCGTLFNPISIERNISAALARETPSIENFGSLWGSWNFSTLFSSTNPEHALEKCTEGYRQLNRYLSISGSTVIITFGTAFVYYLDSKGIPVANCHKQPAKLFTRWLTPASEISRLWIPMVKELKNRGLNVMFTLSPVRHIKDGFEANSLSKSILRVAIAEICSATGAEYFPAYEILTDDLRDYRFYADDLVHPSAKAVEYIWDIFQRQYLEAASIALLNEARALRKRLEHKSFNADSEQTAEFLRLTNAMVERSRSEHPYMKL